jgi:hypothetical protein
MVIGNLRLNSSTFIIPIHAGYPDRQFRLVQRENDTARGKRREFKEAALPSRGTIIN